MAERAEFLFGVGETILQAHEQRFAVRGLDFRAGSGAVATKQAQQGQVTPERSACAALDAGKPGHLFIELCVESGKLGVGRRELFGHRAFREKVPCLKAAHPSLFFLARPLRQGAHAHRVQPLDVRSAAFVDRLGAHSFFVGVRIGSGDLRGEPLFRLRGFLAILPTQHKPALAQVAQQVILLAGKLGSGFFQEREQLKASVDAQVDLFTHSRP